MKITKLKTMMGEAQGLTAVELEKIVERMRSETTKKTAETIREEALLGRMQMNQGGARYFLAHSDRLPYVIFGATFGKNGFDEVNDVNPLLLLTLDCPEGLPQVEALKRLVSQVPYTLLCFAGVSGVTLKVVVRLPDGFRPDALTDAQANAISIYEALSGGRVVPAVPSLMAGCRMSYDANLFYNPGAQPLPVVLRGDAAAEAYGGAVADDDGAVGYPAEAEQQQRMKMELQTCLQKALSESEDDMDHCLQLLADYCAAAHLPEEGCVRRIVWMARFRQQGEDLVRKTFRAAYQKPHEGRPLSQMNEKERIMRSIEDFLGRRYQLRYNVVKQMVEFRPNDMRFLRWQPLDDRQLRSIVVEEMKEGGESWMNDIRTYIQSAHVPDYNPILEFLYSVGEWDMKKDYIEDFARRLPTGYDRWPQYFHRWFLALVAQALNLSRDFGNSVVPMLIGGQGIKKSTFCRNILPPALREYFMNDIKMDNAEQVERVLGRMWLVCIDEYNAKTDREQAKIKRLLTEKDVQIRKMRSDQYTMTPRLCSFIATTNDTTPLPSGDGSRRYLCVEVTGQVDMSSPIPYRQMFAQAMSELRERDCIYWFTSEDEREIQAHNAHYQQQSSLQQVLEDIFEPASEHSRQWHWTVLRIQQELAKRLKAKDVPNFRQLGTTLKQLGWPYGGIDGHRGYYLKLRSV